MKWLYVEESYIKITFRGIPPLEEELLLLVNNSSSAIKFPVDF